MTSPRGPDGDANASGTSIPGLSGFADLIDLVEGLRSGNLYVSDLARNELVLLRPTMPAPEPGFGVALIVGVLGLVSRARRWSRAS